MSTYTIPQQPTGSDFRRPLTAFALFRRPFVFKHRAHSRHQHHNRYKLPAPCLPSQKQHKQPDNKKKAMRKPNHQPKYKHRLHSLAGVFPFSDGLQSRRKTEKACDFDKFTVLFTVLLIFNKIFFNKINLLIDKFVSLHKTITLFSTVFSRHNRRRLVIPLFQKAAIPCGQFAPLFKAELCRRQVVG